MSKFRFFCASLTAFSCAFCDTTEENLSEFVKESTALSALEIAEAPVMPAVPVHLAAPQRAMKETAKEISLSPFTGKVKGKRVRLRTQPDLESHVVKELLRNDLLIVVGEKGDFYAVETPAEIKGYVFRSYILDGVVEANKVNIRLTPDLEAPIIGHLSQGDKIDGSVSAANSKWYEITPPSKVRLYIAKDYVENIGGTEMKMKLDKRRQSIVHLMDSANQLALAEMRKTFQQIDMDRIAQAYNVIIKDYADFPESVEQAREALVLAQEAYLQKKIGFLESKTNSLAMEDEVASFAISKEPSAVLHAFATDKMKQWEPIEEAIYLTWSRINEGKDLPTYYEEQKMKAIPVTGIVEAYGTAVKNKPGDFVLKEKDLPVAYIYSTQVDLQNYIGKRITIMGSPRPNNHFAFPAYFAFSVD